MTEEELDELIEHCPILYHIAERGSWQSIKEHGLLSTSALLERYKITGDERKAIEERHRPESVPIKGCCSNRVVIRDQKPMRDNDLRKCLLQGLTPADWYKILNRKVFFWLTNERLIRMTSAKHYKDKEHDVLEVCTRSLVEAHREKIWLCSMNSGCTRPFPNPRGKDTFSRIGDYPYSCWRKKRRKGERVVELAVDCAVPDIAKHVSRVVVMKGDDTVCVIK